jgi:vancomycin resistance protein YoaR
MTLIIVLGFLVIVTPALTIGIFQLSYIDKVYPGVRVDGTELGHLHYAEARTQLAQIFQKRLESDISYVIPRATTVGVGKVQDYVDYDIDKTVQLAMSVGRHGSFIERVREQVRLVRDGIVITPSYSFNKQLLENKLDEMVDPYEKPVVESTLATNKDIVYLTQADAGIVADRDQAVRDFENYLTYRSTSPKLLFVMHPQTPRITESAAVSALQKAQNALSRELVLKSHYAPGSEWRLDKGTLFSLLDLTIDSQNRVDVVVKDYKVASYSGKIASVINKDPVEARFQLDGDRVSVFEPGQAGYAIDSLALTSEISSRVFDTSTPAEIEIPVKENNPALTTENVNTYGIKEVVGQGKSKFAGSIPGRLHNIELASSKLNGVLIKPGEVFSMYKYVGEVEAATGFTDAYIIKDGRTVPGVGGGLCQVSTTLFRAVLNAGLPVKERHEHAYRVHYYEEDSPAGIDAAVYFPSWDFKFINDTGNYLLLQTRVDLKKMTAEFNLYGVKGGRVVEISKPVMTSQTPPPPELRQDDPTLPRGQVKQVDWSAWGATVSFTRKVTDKDGKALLNDTFKSNYRPWQAVYLVGTKDN